MDQMSGRINHNQTLVAQKIRDGADPYATKPLFDRTSGVKKGNAHVFNIPKRGGRRAEHHRDLSQMCGNGGDRAPASGSGRRYQAPGSNSGRGYQAPASGTRIASNGSESAVDLISQPSSGFYMPSYMSQYGPEYASAANAAPVQIARPTNQMPATIPAAPRPMYSINTGQAVTAGQWRQPYYVPPKPAAPKNVIDLTSSEPMSRDPDDHFDVSRAVASEDQFGSYDPYDYVDQAQASENIKALLEGAFEEDEDDKPKRNLRKRKDKPVVEKKKSAADRLADGIKSLEVSKAEEQKAKAAEAEQEDDEDEEDDGAVEGLKVKLLPHQIDGLTWMMDKEIGKRKKNGVLPKGGILADDMGLGKTIQALSLIMSNPRPSKQWIEEHPKENFPTEAGKGTLVVAPLALIKQWEAEIGDKVLPSHKLKVLVHHGASRKKSFEDLKKYDVVITTYQTLTSEHEGSSKEEKGLKVGCFGVHWYRVILDEAHSIKNRNAKMTKASYELQSVYRWCLTGTPMQNNLDELQSLIHFLQIKPYTDLKVWKDQIGKPMKNGRGGLAMKRLQFYLKAFMKRRTKDVLKQDGGLNFGKSSEKKADGGSNGFKIVGREVRIIEAEFDKSEREFYDKLAARTEKSLEAMMGGAKTDYIGALVLLLRLRQTCNHPSLIRKAVKGEAEAIASGSQGGRKGNLMDDDLDDVTNLFSNLSVKTKKCDICQAVIPKDEAADGAIRCADCEQDLANQPDVVKKSHKKKKHSKGHKKNRTSKNDNKMRRQNARRIIEDDEDDDDESDEGDWIVPPSQQQDLRLGKAGGQEDEDAEGGGEWLVSGDENDDEDTTTSDSDVSSSSEEEHITSGTLGSSTKIRHLLNILKTETPDSKVIVFSEFTSMLDLVEPFLEDADYRFVRYDGKMRNDAREASLQALRTDPKTRILLCSLRCGSLGLNLTAASRVVILEPFWNPFVEEQAIDRVHRLNQTHDVVVYRLTIKDSVEERILALQEKKRELANAAIEGGKAVAKLSMKDILNLFNRNAEQDPSHEDGVSSRGSFASLASAPQGRERTSGGNKVKQGMQFGEAYARRW